MGRRALITVGALVLAVAACVTATPFGRTERAAASTDYGARTGFADGGSILWLSDAQLAADLDGMAAVGARWVRVDFDWPSAQPTAPSGGATFNWSAIDRVVDAASARGLHVLAMAAYTPRWARPAGCTSSDKCGPADPADYAAFVRAAAERYAPRGVHAWEIWNEPNHAQFWLPAPDPAAYTRLLQAAWPAIHGVDPAATVVTGGLAPATDTPGGSLSPNTFLSRVYQDGGGPYLDAVGMHPYSYPYAPTTAEAWNTFYMLPWTYAIMAANGDGAKKIWATEVGFGTGTGSKAVSDTTQAQMVGAVVRAWYSFSFAGNLFWYNYRDLGTDASQVWLNMGIVRHDYRAKAARSAFASALTGTTSTPAVVPTPERAPTPKRTSAPATDGPWLVTSDARLLSTGSVAVPAGAGRGLDLRRPVVGAAPTPSGHGAWLVASDGGVFSFGDAHFHGSTGNLTLTEPIVGMAATPTGHGYWLVASDGGVFSFGDARFYGSTGNLRLTRPVVGMMASHSGHGYLMVASDGGIFAFGDARFYGSTGGRTLPAPIIGMTSSASGRGYWLVGLGGRVDAFGDAASVRGTSGHVVVDAVRPGA